MSELEESEDKPYSSGSSTPPGRLTLGQYQEVLAKRAEIESNGYVSQLEDWLLCDKWPELDACYILAGLVPKTLKSDEEQLVRVLDGNRPSRSDIDEYERIKSLWLRSDHDKLNEKNFVEVGEASLSSAVRPEYAYEWAKGKGIECSWLDTAIKSNTFSEGEKESDLFAVFEAQAEIHHQFLIGLLLMVSLEEGREKIFDWIFCLFRSLHEQKFISSFSKLGLEKLPHAVACAKYHVLSNSLGGVSVEYMEESDKKAWVRFRYPRWLYSSAAICGIPIEVSRGFLHGWYAHNGISLNNPKLGFVCVSEDMTGQFGLCGYFKEFDHKLSLEDRLQFSADEVVPDFSSQSQPSLPDEFWGCERLMKAKRNYAIDYYCNSLVALGEIIGFEKAEQYGMRVGRLIGAQYYRDLAMKINVIDGGPKEAIIFIEKMMSGLGDLSVAKTENQDYLTLRHVLPGFLRGLGAQAKMCLLNSWIEIWKGTIISHQTLMEVQCVENKNGEELEWNIKSKQKKK